MFREATRRDGEVGRSVKQFIDKGQLVPDEITIQVVKLWLEEHGRERGFIFDGFPRTLGQAQAFDLVLAKEKLPITAAILLEVSEEETIERVLGRVSCEKCGALYHRKLVPPKRSGICDACGGKLIRRADDTEATVHKRLDVYQKLTLDVVKHYDAAGLLKRVNGSLPREQVFEEILKIVRS